MSIAAASLTATEVGFFSVVATVIPVFLLAYLIQLGKTVDVLRPRVESGWRKYFGMAVLIGVQRPPKGRVRAVAAGVLGLTTALAFGVVIQAVLAVAVLAPAAAEYVALHALYADKTSEAAKQLCVIGAVIAGGIVIAPLVVRGVVATWGLGAYADFAKFMWRVARRQPRAPDDDEDHASGQPSRAPSSESDASTADR
jgi:hypothetical protein